MVRISFCLRRLSSATCSTMMMMMKSTIPEINTQKEIPIVISISMKQSPKRLSVIPMKKRPMVVMCLKLSCFSSWQSKLVSPLAKYWIILQMSYAWIADPIIRIMKLRLPMHNSSWKMDWQQISLEMQTDRDSSGQDWQQVSDFCLPQRRLMYSERYPCTMKFDSEGLMRKSGISMVAQSQQAIENTKTRKISRLTMEVSSSLFLKIS